MGSKKAISIICSTIAPALIINILRVGNEDTLKIANTVKKWVGEEAPEILPGDVDLQIWRDDSLFLKGRLELLIRNAIFGLILVALVLALFLRPSLALLVTIGIPVSFCGAVMLMPYTGISINLLSLFAFILVLGIVVDDAIIVGENVYRRMRLGEDPKIAAPMGTREVGVIVIFGILTTVMAFTPMLSLGGISGKIWPNIPLIVIPTLIFSLLQSKLILPAHLSLLKPYRPDQKKGLVMKFQNRFARGMESFVDRFYRPMLSRALQFRWVVFVGFVSLLVVTFAYVKNGHLRFEFLPAVEGEIISVRLQMSEGVPFSTTQKAVQKITEAAHQLGKEYADNDGNGVTRNVLASSGTQPFVIAFEGLEGTPTATHLGEVTIELQPAANRSSSTEELISRWRDLIGPIAGADLAFRTETSNVDKALEIEITGSRMDQLKAATEDLKAAILKFQGVINVNDTDKAGKRELKLKILPEAEALGLRLSDVAFQVRQGFFGDEIQRLQRGKNEVIVYVRYPRDERKSIANLENMKIRTPTGAEVPFSRVATVSFGRSPSLIRRTDGQRSIRVTADIEKGSGANVNEIVASLKQGMETRSQLWRQNLRNKIRGWLGAGNGRKKGRWCHQKYTSTLPRHCHCVRRRFERSERNHCRDGQKVRARAARYLYIDGDSPALLYSTGNYHVGDSLWNYRINHRSYHHAIRPQYRQYVRNDCSGRCSGK